MLCLKSNYRYEDGESIVRKVSSAADFVWSDAPLEILGSVTSIVFEGPTSLPIRDHALTTEEVPPLILLGLSLSLCIPLLLKF